MIIHRYRAIAGLAVATTAVSIAGCASSAPPADSQSPSPVRSGPVLSITVTGGCPPVARDILVFTYSHAPDADVEVGLSGCAIVSNGQIYRSAIPALLSTLADLTANTSY
jgi:hypothetical protein